MDYGGIDIKVDVFFSRRGRLYFDPRNPVVKRGCLGTQAWSVVQCFVDEMGIYSNCGIGASQVVEEV